MKYKLKKGYVYNLSDIAGPSGPNDSYSEIITVVPKGTILYKHDRFNSYVDEWKGMYWDRGFVENNSEWFEPLEEKEKKYEVRTVFNPIGSKEILVYYSDFEYSISEEQKELIEKALNGELYEEHELKGFLNFCKANKSVFQSVRVNIDIDKIFRTWKESKEK